MGGGRCALIRNRPTRRLAVEILEDRTVPTVWTTPFSASVVHDHLLTVASNVGLLQYDMTDSMNPLSVAGVNGAPTAIGQTITLPDGAGLTMQANGGFVFSPVANSAYVESFVCSVTDGASSASQTVTINVTAMAPSAAGQSLSIGHDQVLTNINLLANSLAPDGGTLCATIASAPANGVTSENSNGTYNYTPKAGWTGTDSFTFTVTDGILTSLPATVSIRVTETPPIAVNAEFSTLHDQALTVDAWDGVLANATDADGDALTAIVVQSSPYVTLASDGSFVCTPPAAWAGDITFTYAASDGIAQSNVATVTIHVTDQAPVATSYDFTLHAGLMLNLDSTDGLLHDAYDADGDPMTVQLVGAAPANGALNLQPDGSMMYVAKTGFVGDDFFSYRLSDGVLFSQTMIVTIHVQDGAPVASPASFGVWYTNATDANVLANATDADNDALTAVPQPGNLMYASSFTLNPNGTFSYVRAVQGPLIGTLNDYFSYRAFDGTLYSAPVVVTLNLTDTPIAKDNSYVLDSSGQLTVLAANGNGLLANDFNPMGAQVTAQLVQPMDPGVGAVNVNPDGGFTFTAAANFQGEADFTYGLAQGGVLIFNALYPSVRIIANPFVAASVGLNSVNFSTNAAIVSDIPMGGFVPPETTGVGGDPISFTRGTTISLAPTFTITPNSVPFWSALGNNLLVRADSNIVLDNGQTLKLGWSQNIRLQVNASDEQLSTQGFVSMDNPLPNYTGYYPSLNLVWQISPDNGTTWITPTFIGRAALETQTVGNLSSNETFVTLGNPNGWNNVPSAVAALAQLAGWSAPLALVYSGFSLAEDKPRVPLTVIYVGVENCPQGNGATDNASLLSMIWDGSAFQGLNVTDAGGTPLKYLGNWLGYAGNTPLTTSSLLIRYKNGQDSAWAQLFTDALRAWGDTAVAANNIKTITPIRSNRYAPEYMLIGQWYIGPDGENVPDTRFFSDVRQQGFGWYNVTNPQTFLASQQANEYLWAVPPSVFPPSIPIPGQNNPYPPNSVRHSCRCTGPRRRWNVRGDVLGVGRSGVAVGSPGTELEFAL